MSHLREMGGILTIFAADRSEIYGELSSVEWREEDTKGGPNQVLTGVAGEGTLRAFLELDRAGIDHVAFEYECAGIHYGGDAVLLRPQPTDAPTSGIITIEATKGPFLL